MQSSSDFYETALSVYCLSYTLGNAVNKTEKNACPYRTDIPVGKRDSKSNEYLNHTICEKVIVPEGKRREHQGDGRGHINYIIRWGHRGPRPCQLRGLGPFHLSCTGAAPGVGTSPRPLWTPVPHVWDGAVGPHKAIHSGHGCDLSSPNAITALISRDQGS